MAVALCPAGNFTNIFQETFTDVTIATAGSVQACAPADTIKLFSQNSSAFGQLGCDVSNQTLVQVNGGSFVTDTDGYRVRTLLTAIRQVPVATGTGSFNLCPTEDEFSAGFLILLAQLMSASEFLSLRIGRLPAFCRPAVDFAVGNGVDAQISAGGNVLGTAPANPDFTGDCDLPLPALHNISLESPTGTVARAPSVAVGFGDLFQLDVAFEKFVGRDFCFSVVDLLTSCGAFREPCTPCSALVTCPIPLSNVPTGPFILQTVSVTGWACESICPGQGGTYNIPGIPANFAPPIVSGPPTITTGVPMVIPTGGTLPLR